MQQAGSKRSPGKILRRFLLCQKIAKAAESSRAEANYRMYGYAKTHPGVFSGILPKGLRAVAKFPR
jgi:hypothetical protein